MATRFNSSLTITVKIQGGVDINTACADLLELAQRNSAWVEADFNGVTLLVCPTTDVDVLADRYFTRLEDESGYKIASAH